MPLPTGPPLGIRLANTTKAVSQDFDDALATAGGSRSTSLVLMSLKARPVGNQRELAAAVVGIQGATLTQHLNTLESDGLLTRRRDPHNRRVHLVELTTQGETACRQIREAAVSFDRRLRTGFDDADIPYLEELLSRPHDNVTNQADPAPKDHQ